MSPLSTDRDITSRLRIERQRAYNRRWQKAKRDRLKSERSLQPARSCLICEVEFVPSTANPRVKYCSRVCNARSMQLRRYGLTPERFREMIAEQGGTCAICLKPPGGRGWQVDHNHTTRVVRALLCDGCNPGLGNFREDPNALRRAAHYLERFNS